jgi:hypothetical protein
VLPEGLYAMKVSNDTNSDRTSVLPICPKHVVLPNVVYTLFPVIIIKMILTFVFWLYINIAHWFGYSNIATGMTHLIKQAVEGKDLKWRTGVGM